MLKTTNAELSQSHRTDQGNSEGGLRNSFLHNGLGGLFFQPPLRGPF